jgi:glutaredoxin-like protein
MGKFLNSQIIQQIGEAFAELKEPVQILYFGSKESCETCEETRQLLEEVAAANDKLGLDVYDFENDEELANKFNVNKVPGVVIAARDGDRITDFGIQFSGIPAGYEFSTLINDILLVSKRDSGLSSKAREFLKNLDKPLLLQVFVTPT